jgi:dihydrofolate reductase
MKCSVFIATSLDGYIARKDGSVDWLHSAGNPEADMGSDADMGFASFMSSVDCMIMGRKCMEMISSMNLSEEQWPYGNTHIVVLSNTLSAPPENLKDKVSLYSGDITDLMTDLEEKGYRHAYVDGGATITEFLNHGLINEMVITKAPVLLGEGIPLFGKLEHSIKLIEASAKNYANDFVQLKYSVKY